MGFSLLILLLCCAAVVDCQLSLTESEDCKANESFQTCGTACEPSCDNLNPSFCTLQCVVGCQCDKGFVRDANRNCVLPHLCTINNETSNSSNTTSSAENPCNLIDCRAGTTCSMKNGEPLCTPDIGQSCTTMKCAAGYTCEATVSVCSNPPCSEVARCIPEKNKTNTKEGCDVIECDLDEKCIEDVTECIRAPCPVKVSCVKIIINSESGLNIISSMLKNKCPQNQTMIQCSNVCREKKCPEMENKLVCTKRCSVGCSCSEGYLRSNDGECYNLNDCPQDQICGLNEEYKCSVCEGSCKNPYPSCSESTCSKKCVCSPGFVRKNGSCVTLKNCPSHDHGNITCLGTQQFTDCLAKCTQLCTGGQSCENMSRSERCKPGCVCQSSYKLDSNGECVHNRHCFKTTTCPINEEWSKCASNEEKCSTTITEAPQHDQCFSGCACVIGFARNVAGKCVEQQYC